MVIHFLWLSFFLFSPTLIFPRVLLNVRNRFVLERVRKAKHHRYEDLSIFALFGRAIIEIAAISTSSNRFNLSSRPYSRLELHTYNTHTHTACEYTSKWAKEWEREEKIVRTHQCNNIGYYVTFVLLHLPFNGVSSVCVYGFCLLSPKESDFVSHFSMLHGSYSGFSWLPRCQFNWIPSSSNSRSHEWTFVCVVCMGANKRNCLLLCSIEQLTIRPPSPSWKEKSQPKCSNHLFG